MGKLNNLFGTSTTVTVNDVIKVLDEISISPNQIKTEKTVENLFVKELRLEFEGVHQQYNVGGYLGLKSDIDIGNGDVGIELKLASSLNRSAANIQRLFGQAIYYQKRLYENDLIVVIVGTSKYKDEPFMVEIMEFLEDLGITVYYKETSRK